MLDASQDKTQYLNFDFGVYLAIYFCELQRTNGDMQIHIQSKSGHIEREKLMQNQWLVYEKAKKQIGLFIFKKT